MNKYKENYSASHKYKMEHGERNSNPNRFRWYSKEFKEQVIKTIASCKELGFTWEEIEKEIKAMYGIKGDVSTFRKTYQSLIANGGITSTIDAPTGIDLLAKAMNKKQVEDKLVVKRRNLLNNELNVLAYRKAILECLEGFEWKKYLPYLPNNKVSKNANKPLNRGVFLISDEHFRGNVDIEHLQNLYDSIQEQIKLKKYDEVELWYLGDGIDGLIHLGSLASNDGSIFPAMTYINILIERVNRIPQVKEIKFVAQSNHLQTRALGSKRSELAKEDISYLLLNTMKYGLRKDIKIVESNNEGVIMCDYQGLSFALLHGHQKYAKTRAKTLEYWNSMYGYIPNVIIMGHFHMFKQTEYGLNKWMICCPAIKKDNGAFENDMGFLSTGQYLIMEIKDKTPYLTPITLGDDYEGKE